jgi:hypothetical protein
MSVEEVRRKKKRKRFFLPSQQGGSLPMSPPENNPPVTEDPQPAKPGDEPASTKTAEKLKKGEKRLIQGAAAVTGASLAARAASMFVKKKDSLPAAAASLALPLAGLTVAYRHRRDKTAAYDAGVDSGVRLSC